VGAEHALAVYLDARGVPVRHGAEVTAAGQSADEAHVEVSGARHTARDLAGTDGAHNMVRKAAGIGFGADSPSWLVRTTNTGRRGRRQPGLELAATRTGRPDSHATHSVTVIPAVN